MKSHYELLGVEPSSDTETIKRAFRREIARYHPDKVSHLGSEFQEMASARAAELTAAYTTLTNPELRAEYDRVRAGHHLPPPAPARAQPVSEPLPKPATPSSASAGRFEEQRAGSDDIMRRAALRRLHAVLTHAMSDCDAVSVTGFDLAYVSRARGSMFRRGVRPSVLVRLAPMVDRALVSDAWTQAVTARIEQKPVVILLVGNALASTGELGQVIEEHRRRNPELADTLFPVPVDVRDWSAKIPANVPASVRALVDALKTFVS